MKREDFEAFIGVGYLAVGAIVYFNYSSHMLVQLASISLLLIGTMLFTRVSIIEDIRKGQYNEILTEQSKYKFKPKEKTQEAMAS